MGLSARVMARPVVFTVGLLAATALARGQSPGDLSDLSRLEPGRTAAVNSLWIENPLSARFNAANHVTVAEIAGPAQITMIHFALPASEVGAPIRRLDRDAVLRIYWDGETTPSVDVPLVDFFCDPAGLRDRVNTAVVNKKRGFNAYFPMPFRKSARVELVYDGPIPPGDELWRIMPCYSYVMYRALESVPSDRGYFHASWRQEALKLGTKDYLALEAKGRGKFVGWNVSLRLPGRDGYPVDMNEKFQVDGEDVPSVELQGIEDSFGFSWGFPPAENEFPLTGYFPFLKGAAAYRFFVQDAISFEKGLRVTIGFGEHEDPMFRREFSKFGTALQLSSTCYWYQVEPHAPLPALPPSAERKPGPEEPFWPEIEPLPTPRELRERGVKLYVCCGRPKGEVILAEPGFALADAKGETFAGWPGSVYYCRSGVKALEMTLRVPPGARGMVRLHFLDPDRFQGGRKQTILVAGRSVGTFEGFVDGRWIEVPVSPADTAAGAVTIRVENARDVGNAVLSIAEWVEGKNSR
ncbi:glycoside hydrolase family 172 protein [Aquisphaera insulae]|uniref:glycoside hydrolase family 172 protein n=1 Tax=Aquisphaera insulae TaxID=2712864 RepID=UPI0013EC98FF|nr:glycoside hydrolase family 172 protein [Aquisphaera insulae]